MNLPKNVIVTCGPSYEPIDEVRRLTNFSTGDLGMMLANHLAKCGYQVTCFKGVGATTKIESLGVKVVDFTTNDHLLSLLKGYQEPVLAVFHAAALCDFKVGTVDSRADQEIGKGKISSREGVIHLALHPAVKIISLLRAIFPMSRIVGWKYEVEGNRSDSIARGQSQINQNGTNACVVNGPAYGDGFGYLESGVITHIETRRLLCEFLAKNLNGTQS